MINEQHLSGVQSGFPTLDSMTGGWQRGHLIVLASRPSVGKTSFAMNIACYAALRQKIPVAYFSLELPRCSFVRRIVSGYYGLNRNGFNEEIPSIKEILSAGIEECLSLDNFFIDDAAKLNLADFKEKSMTLMEKRGVRMIVVDYLQLMAAPKGLQGDRSEEIHKIVRSLKSNAKELDVAIIVLSQLPQGEPDLVGLSNAGVLVSFCDEILMLDRSHQHGCESNERVPLILTVMKNRNGRLGEVQMSFDTERLTFNETNQPRVMKP